MISAIFEKRLNQIFVIRNMKSEISSVSEPNARYRWGVPGRCHSYFTLETHSDHGFAQRAPATTKVVSSDIGVCETVRSLTEPHRGYRWCHVHCGEVPAVTGEFPQELVAFRFKKIILRPPPRPASTPRHNNRCLPTNSLKRRFCRRQEKPRSPPNARLVVQCREARRSLITSYVHPATSAFFQRFIKFPARFLKSRCRIQPEPSNLLS